MENARLLLTNNTLQLLKIALENNGHDPATASEGWRSSNPVVVALLFAAHGYPVFPCNEFKMPLTRNGLNGATTNLKTILGWDRFNKMPGVDRYQPCPGWCVRTGRYESNGGPLGLWIPDIDDAAGYARLAELEKELVPLPKETWTVMSCRDGGGEHRYFAPACDGPDMKTVPRALINGARGQIDQKGRGGYVVTAGSYHGKTNRNYRWKEGCAPDEIPLAPFPREWVAAMDKADEPTVTDRATPRSRTNNPKRVHDPASYLIGDCKGFGGFQGPIYKIAIQFFLMTDVEAPAETIIETLRELIVAAPKDSGRDVSRYLSGPDLPRVVERARAFVMQLKEVEYVECE